MTDDEIEQLWAESDCPHKSLCRYDFGCHGLCTKTDRPVIGLED